MSGTEDKNQRGSAVAVGEDTITDNWSGGGDISIVDSPDISRNESVRDVNAMRDELAEIDKKIDAGEPFEPTPKPDAKQTGEEEGDDEGKTADEPDDAGKSEDDQPDPGDTALSDDDWKQLDEKYLGKLLATTPHLQRYQQQGLRKILENYNNGVGFMDRVRTLANSFNVSTREFVEHLEGLAQGGGSFQPRYEQREQTDTAPTAISDDQIKAIADELAVKPETVKSMFGLFKAALGINQYDERLRSIESEVGQTRQLSNEQRWNSLWGTFAADTARAEVLKKMAGEDGNVTVARDKLWSQLVELEREQPGYCRKLLEKGVNPFERALKEYALNSSPELMMDLIGAKPNKKTAPRVQVPSGSADRDKNRSARRLNKSLDEMTIEELEAAAARASAQ